MIKIPIKADPNQSFPVPFENDLIYISLKYKFSGWYMDIKYGDKARNGIRLCSRVLLLKGLNLPFEIIIDDKGLELDPFSLNCFSDGLFDFNIFEREDMEDIRGYDVR